MKKLLFCFLFCFFCIGCGNDNKGVVNQENVDQVVDQENINQDSAEVNKNLLQSSITERENKNFKKALDIADQIIQKHPNSSVGYCEAALSYYGMGDIDKAKEYIKKSLEKNPEDIFAQKAQHLIMNE